MLFVHTLSLIRLTPRLSGKETAFSAGGAGEASLIPGSGRSPGGRNDNPVQYSSGKSHEQRNLVGYSP